MGAVITGVSVISDRKNFELNFLLESITDVLKESSIEIGKENSRQIGLFLGTTLSSFHIRYSNFQRYLKEGIRKVNPVDVPRGLISFLGGEISAKLKIRGALSTLSSGSSSGLDALVQGRYFIERDIRNKCIVVELQEAIIQGSVQIGRGSVCMVLENAESIRSGNFWKIMAIESFFEKPGENQGLIRAIKQCLKIQPLDVQSLDGIFFGGNYDINKALLEKKALGHFGDISQFKLFSCSIDNNFPYGSLFYLGNILKERFFCPDLRKDKTKIIFISRGHNNNSVCVMLNLSTKRIPDNEG